MTATQEATTIRLSDLDMTASGKHCQIRGCCDSDVVEEYAAQMKEGVEFPPVHVFTDGTSFWLVDGFHRGEAAADAGLDELPCILHEGTLRDAILFAVGANAHHGLRRSNADKRRSVQTLLDDDAWSKWSDRKIARACGVSQPFVSAMRKEGDNGYHSEQETPAQESRDATPQSPLETNRSPTDEPSSVPSELGGGWERAFDKTDERATSDLGAFDGYNPLDHNEEVQHQFEDDEPQNKNRLAHFHKTTIDQVKGFIAQGEYSALLAISDHLGEALDLVNSALEGMKVER